MLRVGEQGANLPADQHLGTAVVAAVSHVAGAQSCQQIHLVAAMSLTGAAQCCCRLHWGSVCRDQCDPSTARLHTHLWSQLTSHSVASVLATHRFQPTEEKIVKIKVA